MSKEILDLILLFPKLPSRFESFKLKRQQLWSHRKIKSFVPDRFKFKCLAYPVTVNCFETAQTRRNIPTSDLGRNANERGLPCHMKAIKDEAISKQTITCFENWFMWRSMLEEIRFEDLFSSTRKCWSNMTVLNWKFIQRTLTMKIKRKERTMKGGRDEKRNPRLRFRILLKRVKLLGTREKSHKVRD